MIKLLIWQAFFSDSHPTQREIARQLGVCPSYVCKVQKQGERGLDFLASEQRVTLDDLDKARRFTAEVRNHDPGLLRRPEGGDRGNGSLSPLRSNKAILGAVLSPHTQG